VDYVITIATDALAPRETGPNCMAVPTRYRISDADVPGIRSFPVLREIPYFLRHHRRRLRLIGDLVATVSNRAHLHPTYIHINAFHRHQTLYAAIDALAPPLAEFFEQTDILPIMNPIFARYEQHFKNLAPRLAQIFVQRGILIPSELRDEE
jgi:hypothetical protein